MTSTPSTNDLLLLNELEKYKYLINTWYYNYYNSSFSYGQFVKIVSLSLADHKIDNYINFKLAFVSTDLQFLFYTWLPHRGHGAKWLIEGTSTFKRITDEVKLVLLELATQGI